MNSPLEIPAFPRAADDVRGDDALFAGDFLAGAFLAGAFLAGDFLAALFLRAGAFLRAAFFAVFRRPFLAAIGCLPLKDHLPATSRSMPSKNCTPGLFSQLS